MALGVDRERMMREATFWLRPDFVIRCLRRFQAVTGFDRAIALASLAFTAVVPLGMVIGAVLPSANVGERAVARFGLKGDGAQAIDDLLDSTDSVGSGFSIFGLFMVVVAVLSFARAAQRLYENTWELPPLSIRNTLNGLRWIAALVVYFTLVGIVRTQFATGVLEILIGVLLLPAALWFFTWSGMVLSDRRLTSAQLLPGAIVVTLVLFLYGIGSDIYVPRLFNSYASRYGAIGVTFALVSWLFGVMVCLVGSTVVGREIWSELQAIRRGDKPSTEQIDAEWAQVREQIERGRAEVESRRDELRRRWHERRAAKAAAKAASSGRPPPDRAPPPDDPAP